MPETLQAKHILQAFESLRREGIPARYKSTKWDVLDSETEDRFPPKEVLRRAKGFVGDNSPEPTGGEPTNERLTELGYDVVLKEGREQSEEEADITSVLTDSIDQTTKMRLINARLGQGGFRERLLEMWERKCALTECDFEPLLRASHIKPWRQSSNRERLDPSNGLLLAAHIDALFDRFLLSFADDGSLMVSQKVPTGLLQSLGVLKGAKVDLRGANRKYLSWHRKEFDTKTRGSTALNR